MKIDVKIINDYTREVSIDVPWSELESDFDSTIKKFRRKIKMPGFRPGKIPRDRLMQQFQSNIEAEFMEDNIQKFYLLSLQQGAGGINDIGDQLREPRLLNRLVPQHHW